MGIPSEAEGADAGTRTQARPAAGTCPACGARELHRSRLRSRGEALVCAVTPLRPYRCHECNRRRWRVGPIAGSRALAGARRWAAAGRERIAGARASSADVAHRRRHDVARSLRVAALAGALLVMVALLVPAIRWAATRLAGAGRVAATAPSAGSAADANPQRPATPPPGAASAAHGPRPSTKPGSPALRSRAPRAAAESRAGSPRVAPGWDGMRWGMTVREARTALPLLTVAHRRGAARDVARTDAVIGSRPYLAELRFGRATGLEEIQLRPAGETADVDVAASEVLDSLTARFGPPADRREEGSPAGSWRRSAEWATAATRISLRAWKTALPDAHVLRVDVRSGVATPTPHGVEVTYVPLAAAPR